MRRHSKPSWIAVTFASFLGVTVAWSQQGSDRVVGQDAPLGRSDMDPVDRVHLVIARERLALAGRTGKDRYRRTIVAIWDALPEAEREESLFWVARGACLDRFAAAAALGLARPNYALARILGMIREGRQPLDPAVLGWMAFWACSSLEEALQLGRMFLESKVPRVPMMGHAVLTLTTLQERGPTLSDLSVEAPTQTIDPSVWGFLWKGKRKWTARDLLLSAWRERILHRLSGTQSDFGRYLQGELGFLTFMIVKHPQARAVLRLQSLEEFEDWAAKMPEVRFAHLRKLHRIDKLAVFPGTER